MIILKLHHKLRNIAINLAGRLSVACESLKAKAVVTELRKREERAKVHEARLSALQAVHMVTVAKSDKKLVELHRMV